MFLKAKESEATTIKTLLNEYGMQFGEVMNYQKSGIFFSVNVRRDKLEVIQSIMEVSNDMHDSKYLGLPSLIGRSKKPVFNFLKDCVWRKIQDWSHKMLSKAGQTIMVENVAQTFAQYVMFSVS